MPNDGAVVVQLDALRAGAGAAVNEDSTAPEFTDEALALRFTERHKNRLRYVASWGRWLIWDGVAWRFDDTMKAFDLARAVCRSAAAECASTRLAAAIARAPTVAAVERLAKADRRHAATVDHSSHNAVCARA
jgi:putative DNA primase/helicase